MEFFTIAIVHFLAMISPGQNTIGIARYTLQYGRRKAVKFVFGVALGSAIYISFSIFGVMQIILHHAVINKIFLFCSGVYLLYLGVSIMMSHKSAQIDNNNNSAPSKNPIKLGFIISITNPKAPIFYAAILTNFIDVSSSTLKLAAICTYLIITSFIIFLGMSAVFDIFRYKILKYMKYVEKIFAVCLWYFGIKLLISLFYQL